jgi:hypothetical protein
MMKPYVVGLMLLVGLAPAPQERPAPPAGWFCTHDKRAPKAHRCDCQRSCAKGEDGTMSVIEDPTCKVYCHKDHCGCPTGCPST